MTDTFFFNHPASWSSCSARCLILVLLADMSYILCFSLVMLSTDLHNPIVKVCLTLV